MAAPSTGQRHEQHQHHLAGGKSFLSAVASVAADVSPLIVKKSEPAHAGCYKAARFCVFALNTFGDAGAGVLKRCIPKANHVLPKIRWCSSIA
jgi:hypothetical protein